MKYLIALNIFSSRLLISRNENTSKKLHITIKTELITEEVSGLKETITAAMAVKTIQAKM